MLKLSKLFGNHAVLQRNRAIPVWGWTEPFEIVEGSLGGVPAVARAGDDGRFVFRFPPRPAGGPLKLEVRVKSSGETVAYSDILVGEVWIASGQSNMELKIEELPSKCEAVRAEAGKLPQLRMLTVPQRAQPVPMADVAADWQVAGPECVAGWSAVGYFFARKLHRELNVPVGIVSSNWGGTVAEAWTSRETLVRNPDFAARVEAYERNLNAPGMWESLSAEELSVEHCPGGELAWFRRILPPEPENRGVTDGWASPEFDDSGWRTGKLPCFWKDLGLDINGVVWFRREIEIPAAWQGSELVLSLCAIDKHDVTYFNGVEIGRTGQGYETKHWAVPRCYRIPAELVKAGRAVIAVRNYSFVYNGGLHGAADKMWIAPAGEERAPVALGGVWKFKPEFEYPRVDALKEAMGPGNPHSYCMLFDNMIRPLIPMAMRGVIWYQGESNESAPEYYERLMRDLIADWRFRWGQGDFPFLQVLLAGFRVALYPGGAEPRRAGDRQSGRVCAGPGRGCRYSSPPQGGGRRAAGAGGAGTGLPAAGDRLRAGVPGDGARSGSDPGLVRPYRERSDRARNRVEGVCDRRSRRRVQGGRSADRGKFGAGVLAGGQRSGRGAVCLGGQSGRGESVQQCGLACHPVPDGPVPEVSLCRRK